MTIAVRNDTIVDMLNSLIETNRDSENGYRTAADGVERASELSAVFTRYAGQRARFSTELEQEVRTYGGEPDTSGTIGGALRSGWISIKSAVTGGDAHTILAECDRAEEAALANYRDALREELPDYLNEMIRQQHDEIQESLQHIRALKQSYRASKARH